MGHTINHETEEIQRSLDGEILAPVIEQELANSMASGAPNFSSSRRSLCDLGVSAVNMN